MTNIDDVLKELQRLDALIDKRQLDHFRLFNTAYRIVTEHILHAVKSNYFKNSKNIEEFVSLFASYYFKAFDAILQNKLDRSSPWASMGDYAAIKSAPVFLSLLLGANAHINHDLPQALHVFMENKKDDSGLREIATLNKILMKSGKEITTSFSEINPWYDFLKRRFRFLYYRPAMYTILYWRIIAWREYKRLQRDNTTTYQIVHRSSRIAKRLLKIAQVLAS